MRHITVRSHVVEVSLDNLSPDDQELLSSQIGSLDPYAVLRAKTVHLAELLDCSEEQAERLILQRLGKS